MQVSATNSHSAVLQDITISATAAPAVSSASAVTFTVGTAATFGFTAATPDEQRTGDELGDIPTLAVEDPASGAGEESESGGTAPGLLFVVILLAVLLGGGLVTVLVLRARARA